DISHNGLCQAPIHRSPTQLSSGSASHERHRAHSLSLTTRGWSRTRRHSAYDQLLIRVSDPRSIHRQRKGDAVTTVRVISTLSPIDEAAKHRIVLSKVRTREDVNAGGRNRRRADGYPTPRRKEWATVPASRRSGRTSAAAAPAELPVRVHCPTLLVDLASAGLSSGA